MKLELSNLNKELSEISLHNLNCYIKYYPDLRLDLFVELFNKISLNDYNEAVTITALQFARLGNNLGDFTQLQLKIFFDNLNDRTFEDIFYELIEAQHYGVGTNTSENYKYLQEINTIFINLPIQKKEIIGGIILKAIIDELDWNKYYNYEILSPIVLLLNIAQEAETKYDLLDFTKEFIDSHSGLRDRINARYQESIKRY